MRLYRTFTASIAILLALPAWCGFTVHSVKGDVKIKKEGKMINVTKGMKVSPADNVSIGAGCSLEVLNDVNNTIYSSTSAGTFTISRMMLDADIKASDNREAVNSRMRFGTKGSGSGKIYVETGMVKRSMHTFDPDAKGMQMDAATLSRLIVRSVAGQTPDAGNCPVTVNFSCDAATGISFEATNPLDFPIYFNILKVTGESGGIDISCLGQPTGTYVLRPGQSMSRSDRDVAETEARHIMVMTHCQYDIDEVIEMTNRMLSDPADQAPDIDLPVYILDITGASSGI